MLGAGLHFNRSRSGEDRFYNSGKARGCYHRNQGQDHLGRSKGEAAGSLLYEVMEKKISTMESQTASGEIPIKPVVTPALECVASFPLCNLERFLESISPSVPAQYLPKTTVRDRKTCDVEQPFFMLGDLWETFKEWSAYGAGVPLILNDSDCVVQYYVPYLSGIQLYGDKSQSQSSVTSRRLGDDSDIDYYKDSSSDGSSDCEQERRTNHLRGQWENPHFKDDLSDKVDRLSLRDHDFTLQEGFSSDEGESGNSQGRLLFEYLEKDPPYSREPLADKIADLGHRFPDLKTLKSCDLMPSSWISVAWYPIYRIPTGPTLKDLDACFLTFHYLHNQMGTSSSHGPIATYHTEINGNSKISLPVLGLASYKFKVSLWMPNGGSERLSIKTLLKDAENLLTQLQVHHPDFLFFCRG